MEDLEDFLGVGLEIDVISEISIRLVFEEEESETGELEECTVLVGERGISALVL